MIETIQETKAVMDIARAAEIYARRQKLGEEAIRHATDIKFDAERKLEAILKPTIPHEGGRPPKNGTSKEPVPTLVNFPSFRATW